jgi:hypothetical protein
MVKFMSGGLVIQSTSSGERDGRKAYQYTVVDKLPRSAGNRTMIRRTSPLDYTL